MRDGGNLASPVGGESSRDDPSAFQALRNVLTEPSWQFWIDVGGTFTDCVARRPDGVLVRCKLLSSGVIKGSITAESASHRLLTASLGPDSVSLKDHFWHGYQLRVIDDQGRVIHASRVSDSRRVSHSISSRRSVSAVADTNDDQDAAGCDSRHSSQPAEVTRPDRIQPALMDAIPAKVTMEPHPGVLTPAAPLLGERAIDGSVGGNPVIVYPVTADPSNQSFSDVTPSNPISVHGPTAGDSTTVVATVDNVERPLVSPMEGETSWLQLELEQPLPCRIARGAVYELVSDESAPILAIRMLLNLRRDETIPAVSVRLATTRGTNALLTRQGASTGLVTTRGFGDLPWIGTQNRPKLFALAIQKSQPLLAASVEIDARVAADGQVLTEPDPKAIREMLLRLKAEGVESLAICLLHAYRFAEHERLVEQLAREVGFKEISCSNEVAPLIKLVSRCDTTLVDAYLNPVLRAYVTELKRALGPQSSLRLLTSAGGLVESSAFRGKDSILSGPAGGVVGFSRVARACGFDRAIGFDMGGTSTDVARFDGQFDYEFETEKAGVRIVSPMMAIETVAAGGGSVCWFDGVKLRVGPKSAGAEPGPACYGRGGPLTVTDLNLLLGRLVPSEFPFPLDRAAARRRLDELCALVNNAYPTQRAATTPPVIASNTRTDLPGSARELSIVADANTINYEELNNNTKIDQDLRLSGTTIDQSSSILKDNQQAIAAQCDRANAFIAQQGQARDELRSPGKQNSATPTANSRRDDNGAPIAGAESSAAWNGEEGNQACEATAGYTPERLAEGLLRLANANMATAIRSISIHKGFDPADYVLVAFGGAAPQHACALAQELGMRRILIHPDAGVLSALGTGLAEIRRHRALAVGSPYQTDVLERLSEPWDAMIQAARGEIRDEGIAADRMEVIRALDLRYQGVDAYLTIRAPADGDYAREFQQQHQRLYGYVDPERPLEIVAARVEVIGHGNPSFNASRTISPPVFNASNDPSIGAEPQAQGVQAKQPHAEPERAISQAVDGNLLAHQNSRVEAAEPERMGSPPIHRNRNKQRATNQQAMWIDGQHQVADLFRLEELPAGAHIIGPALIVEPLSTTVIDPGWRAERLTGGELLIEPVQSLAEQAAGVMTSLASLATSDASESLGQIDSMDVQVISRSDAGSDEAEVSGNTETPSAAAASNGVRKTGSSDTTQVDSARPDVDTSSNFPLLADSSSQLISPLPRGPKPEPPDPVLLEIFNNHFAGIATQMGITLRNTSSSVNVKERLDFSCALFTAEGDLVVNAPHIPVHLGAMSETVKRALADGPPLEPGDVVVTNDPYRGGSHLPDITVITPVHDPKTGKLQFLTASRAHHAELGGMTPGSMPPFSTNLAQEGVLLKRFLVLSAGKPRFKELRQHLLSGPYPTRAVEDNLADIAAQIAANRQGANDLLRLVQRYTWPVVRSYMDSMLDAAEQKLRTVLRNFPQGRREWIDHLDDGSPIRVAMTIQDDQAIIDFTGTDGILAGNLNANRAIVMAAIIYALRLLIDEEIPINQGLLRPITLILPTCLLNPPGDDDPSRCPAVVGGNVETSQRVVDVLLGALGLAAASQGTMNNLLFGDATFGYYETICGGSGATADAAGADAVHTHMTNTRLTDPEVLELRYPVRLHSFSIRRGSGGAGKQRGGDGVSRQIEFLRELTVSILSQRRGPYPPYGMAGGEPGQCGENLWHHADGRRERLPACCQFQALPGDRLIIHTPGGGGHGRLDDREAGDGLRK